SPLSIKLPPGKLTCSVNTLYGKADKKVIQALGVEPEAGRGVWLASQLNNDSAWIPRAIDVAGWKHGKESRNPANVLLFKTLTLEPGKTHEIRVASPAPSNEEETGSEKGPEDSE